jgi:Flp pilus assembly protein TadG
MMNGHFRRLSSPSAARQRGQVLILVGISLAVLIGAVGLAIDSGRAYGVKARLNAAVDAAAIAAARALSEGADDNARRANAVAVGERFFRMNYPDGFLGSTPSAPTITAVHETSGYWRVNASATASMPTTFMRVLAGDTVVAPSAAGEAIRRDLDVVLVMDVSGSLTSSDLATLKQAATNSFIRRFSAGSNGDRVGLVSFSSGAVVDVAINKTSARGFNRTTVNSAISGLPGGGATASAEGMRKALSELDGVPANLRSSLRVILFFSDGAPNIVSGSFQRSSGSPNPITDNLYSQTGKPTDCGGRVPGSGAARFMWRENARYTPNGCSSEVSNIARLPAVGSGNVPLTSYPGHPFPRTLTPASGSTPTFPFANTRCNVNRAARNMVENVANTAREQEIRVYTIGLGDALQTYEIDYTDGRCGYTLARERGEVILKRLANAGDSDTHNPSQPQGLYCWAQRAQDLDRCFSTIASEILRLTL